MAEQFNSLEDIEQYSRNFAEERNWREYQNPKNLVIALSVEAAELLEHFQWLTHEESQQLSDEKRLQVGDEISDVLFYLVRVADSLQINIYEAAQRKAALNAEKYPLPPYSNK